MDDNLLWIMEIIGPVILLVLLIWLVLRNRSSTTTKTTYDGTKAEYADEEKRRREGTDGL